MDYPDEKLTDDEGLPSIYFYLVPHHRDKKGHSERDCEDFESQHIDHDQSHPDSTGKPRRPMGGSMPTHGFGRCDGHHEMVDCHS
jgi:hypothetical protein